MATPEAEQTKDLYALLHLSPDASDEDIRKAYRQWAQIYHPDKYLDQEVIQVPFYILIFFVFVLLLTSMEVHVRAMISVVLLIDFGFVLEWHSSD